jgi:hypothetical protein
VTLQWSTEITTLYLKQFFAYCFDSKGLGSQDICTRTRLVVQKSNIGHINKNFVCYHSGHIRPLKRKKGLD